VGYPFPISHMPLDACGISFSAATTRRLDFRPPILRTDRRYALIMIGKTHEWFGSWLWSRVADWFDFVWERFWTWM